jgi:hypothetical protein
MVFIENPTQFILHTRFWHGRNPSEGNVSENIFIFHFSTGSRRRATGDVNRGGGTHTIEAPYGGGELLVLRTVGPA